MGVTSVRLTDDLQEQLEATAERLRRSKGWVISTAERLRRSKGWVISEALNEFIAKEERALNRIKRSRKALEQVEAGQVVDGDEVMTWIASWGSDKESSPPK